MRLDPRLYSLRLHGSARRAGEHRDLCGLMDHRPAWLIVVALCTAGVITLVAVRRLAGSQVHGPAVPVPMPATPAGAVARTHFVDGGGYVEIGGVIAWASADPTLRILPGHVLRYEPGGDGHTVTVVLADDSAREEHRA